MEATQFGMGKVGRTLVARQVNGAREAGIERFNVVDLEDRAEALVEQALNEPGLFRDPAYARQIIRPVHERDAPGAVAESDFILDATFEREDVKQGNADLVFANKQPDAIYATNSSTFDDEVFVAGRSQAERDAFGHFHVFTPAQILKGLEIAAEHPRTLGWLREYGRVLGLVPEVVRGMTPGYMGNTIGVEELMRVGSKAEEHGVLLMNALFSRNVLGGGGNLMQTMDTVSFGTLSDVADVLYNALGPMQQGQNPSVSPLNEHVRQIMRDHPDVTKNPRGGGYFNGRELVFDFESGDYRPIKEMQAAMPAIESIIAANQIKGNPAEAQRVLFAAQDLGGQLYRELVGAAIAYAAWAMGPNGDNSKIDTNFGAPDSVMRNGFGRALGYGQIVDLHGLKPWVEAIDSAGLALPQWFTDYAKNNDTLYSQDTAGKKTIFDMGANAHKPVTVTPAQDLEQQIAASTPVLTREGGVNVFDVGDGFYVMRIASRTRTMDPAVLAGIDEAIEYLNEAGAKGLVFHNNGTGANVDLMVGASVLMQSPNLSAEERHRVRDGLEEYLLGGQEAGLALANTSFPVVHALDKMVLGGAYEASMAGIKQVSQAADVGFPESALALFPGWLGTEWLAYQNRDALGDKPHEYMVQTATTILENWQNIRKKGADHAVGQNVLDAKRTSISRDPDAVVYDALESVKSLAEGGDHKHDYGTPITLGGGETYSAIMNLHDSLEAGSSHEYMGAVAKELANALTTGPGGAEQEVSFGEFRHRVGTAFMRLLEDYNSAGRQAAIIFAGGDTQAYLNKARDYAAATLNVKAA